MAEFSVEEPEAELPAEEPEPQAEAQTVRYEYGLLNSGISGATADSEKIRPAEMMGLHCMPLMAI